MNDQNRLRKPCAVSRACALFAQLLGRPATKRRVRFCGLPADECTLVGRVPSRGGRQGTGGQKSKAPVPMAVVPCRVKNGGNHDNLFGFPHFINHAIGETLRIAPTDVLARMATGIKQWVHRERIQYSNYFRAKFRTQTRLLRIIPIRRRGDVLFDFRADYHAPIHEPGRSRRFISSKGTDEAGFCRWPARRLSTRDSSASLNDGSSNSSARRMTICRCCTVSTGNSCSTSAKLMPGS